MARGTPAGPAVQLFSLTMAEKLENAPPKSCSRMHSAGRIACPSRHENSLLLACQVTAGAAPSRRPSTAKETALVMVLAEVFAVACRRLWRSNMCRP